MTAKLIPSPGGYGTAFAGGFIALFSAAFPAFIALVVVAPGRFEAKVGLFGLVFLLSLGAGVVGGCVAVVPKLLYSWAYRYLPRGPEFRD